jgi:hypothetical protein
MELYSDLSLWVWEILSVGAITESSQQVLFFMILLTYLAAANPAKWWHSSTRSDAVSSSVKMVMPEKDFWIYHK